MDLVKFLKYALVIVIALLLVGMLSHAISGKIADDVMDGKARAFCEMNGGVSVSNFLSIGSNDPYKATPTSINCEINGERKEFNLKNGNYYTVSDYSDKELFWSEYNLAGNPYVTCNELVYIEDHKIYCTSDSFDNQDYNITIEIPQLYNCEILSLEEKEKYFEEVEK